ncbi:alpha-2-macroglobulin [Azospirillum sp. B4]|uniref:alpha-2-macroglobulin family protein n=1 Tax=Azospirillum sp. B4 TaxID=95605 RepID=UPI000349A1B6|nr:alpha-2-macroglobulin [Azospirillum sp. B4]
MVRSFAAALVLAVFLPAAASASPQDRAPASPPPVATPAQPGQPGTPPGKPTTPAPSVAPSVDAGPFGLTGLEVNAERDDPEACFTFNRPLAKARPGLQDPYAGKVEVLVKTAPTDAGTPVQRPIQVRDRTLCVQKLEHGRHYAVTLKAGLPAAGGAETLSAPQSREIEVLNRRPVLAFRSGGYILPRIGRDGLPLRTINVERARLQVLHIKDRSLVEQIYYGRLNQTLNDIDVGSLVEKNGELVWRGEMAVGTKRNQAQVTPFPIDAVLGQLKPGVYVAVAEDAGAKTAGWEGRATQWFIVSDLGLTTLSGSNGLLVYVHSLRTATPLAGVEVRVVARDNKELGKALTGADGAARFDAASGAAKGQALFAGAKDGDFGFLDLTAPGLDLAARGAAGRPSPGALDAYVFAERGIYRPGEAVHITTLLRDAAGQAVTGRPLTLKVQRPDGLEIERFTLADRGMGGSAATVDLPGNAAAGTWTVTVHADADGPSVGTLRFQVADFVPPRVNLDLDSDQARVGPDGTLTLSINGRTPSGAPAANLAGTLSVTLRPAANPFPQSAFQGYRFGLAQEDGAPRQETLPGFATDANGVASVPVSLKGKLDGSRPLEAVFHAALFDVGGGTTGHDLVVPVERHPYTIGIRPRFNDDAVPEGATAAFDVVAVAPDGRQLDKGQLSYDLYEERLDYVWFEANGSWDYKPQVRDQKVTGGTLAVTAKAPGAVEVPVSSGRYRLEVYDPATGVSGSVRFAAGSWVSARLGETPDAVEVTVKGAVGGGPLVPGAKAAVFVRPPYRSTVLITLADRAVRQTLTREIGAEGALVEIPVDADIGGGAYVIANAFAPVEAGRRSLPRRAVGVDFLPVAMAAHTLALKLDGPAEAKPRQTVHIPIQVPGVAPGQGVHLVLSAVDQGVLDLTGYKTPDPEAWFFGQRQLGVDIHDVYGRLTAPHGAPGAPPPAPAAISDAVPPRGAPVVALYSGILAVGNDGKVQVPLTLPDFQGRLRLMATAWSAGALGHADRMLSVRDPVQADLALPRFLAPEDTARLALTLTNATGSRGTYTVTLQAEGPLSFPVDTTNRGVGAKKRKGKDVVRPEPRDVVAVFHGLAKGGKVTLNRVVKGLAVGPGRLLMTVKGPEGVVLAREFMLPVRGNLPVVTRHETVDIRPGTTVQVAPESAQGLRPETVVSGLALSPLPELNVPGLLMTLDRNPYGSSEQIASRALPLLYQGDAGKALGLYTDASLRERIDRAIDKLLTLERADGGFALWSADGPAEPWLSAYVMDFLTRARDAGHAVPEAPYRKGLDWLVRSISNSWVEPADLPARAYGLAVAAKAKAVDATPVRYFYETFWDKLPTRLARAHAAAAMAAVGLPQAQDAYARVDGLRITLPGMRDFGSDLRDRAASLALLAEGNVPVDRLTAQAREVQGLLREPALISSQERAWLLVASHGLMQRAGSMTLGVAGQAAAETRPLVRRLEATGRVLTVTNGGQNAVQRTVAISGTPLAAVPAVAPVSGAGQGTPGQGYTIDRRILDLKGHPVDPARIHQNDLLAVVLSGKVEGTAPTQVLVSDPVAAGLTIETVRIARGGLPPELAGAVGDLSDATHVEAREDRYVAAVDLAADRREFRLVYLVRAVLPGTFALAPSQVEEWTSPNHQAVGVASSLTILP